MKAGLLQPFKTNYFPLTPLFLSCNSQAQVQWHTCSGMSKIPLQHLSYKPSPQTLLCLWVLGFGGGEKIPWILKTVWDWSCSWNKIYLKGKTPRICLPEFPIQWLLHPNSTILQCLYTSIFRISTSIFCTMSSTKVLVPKVYAAESGITPR